MSAVQRLYCANRQGLFPFWPVERSVYYDVLTFVIEFLFSSLILKLRPTRLA